MPKAVKKQNKRKGQTATKFGERLSVRLQDDVQRTCNTLLNCIYVDNFTEFVNDLLRDGAAKKLKDILSIKPVERARP